MESKKTYGNVTVFLPEYDTKMFSIFQDLAELFGLEFQSEAVELLKRKLKEIELKPKPTIEYEADNVSIESSSVLTISKIVKAINNLSIRKYKIEDDEEKWLQFISDLKNSKRPKAQKWKLGDVFSLKLITEEFTFGQIVGINGIPTCALFDLKKNNEVVQYEELLNVRVITILHLSPTNLNNFKWKVIDFGKPLIKDSKGPWGKSGSYVGARSASSDYLNDVANYFYFGTHDWYDEKEIKKLVMKKSSLLRKWFR